MVLPGEEPELTAAVRVGKVGHRPITNELHEGTITTQVVLRTADATNKFAITCGTRKYKKGSRHGDKERTQSRISPSGLARHHPQRERGELGPAAGERLQLAGGEGL